MTSAGGEYLVANAFKQTLSTLCLKDDHGIGNTYCS